MPEYIYTRVSTDGQSTQSQLEAIRKKFPQAEVISEIASGAKNRPMLAALIEQLQEGDVVIVGALDRLGRKTTEVLHLIENLEKRGVILISLREGVDYSTPMGRLVTQILVSVAEMERAMISERTKAGLEAAKARGRIGGKKPSIPTELKEEAIQLVRNGASLRRAEAQTGISHSYIAKLLNSSSAEPKG